MIRRRQVAIAGRVSAKWITPHKASPNSIASRRIAVIPARCGLAASAVPRVSKAKLDSQKASVSLTMARLRAVRRVRRGTVASVRTGARCARS
jgi:hypothetical protein